MYICMYVNMCVCFVKLGNKQPSKYHANYYDDDTTKQELMNSKLNVAMFCRLYQAERDVALTLNALFSLLPLSYIYLSELVTK